MTQQSPLERAAMAVMETSQISCGDYDVSNPLDVARAVLMAVREPSEAMVAKGKEQTDFAADAWQAMIDKALSE